jgi:glutathione peroxidase
MHPLFDFPIRTLSGRETTLAEHAGKVLLIVNVASRCGFTPQYAGLQKLQERFGTQGFSVLGFPCNQFGGQEPGAAEEIGAFCSATYGVDFPVYEKIDVNGAGAHPIYRYLKAEAPGILGTEGIKWNFTKFLVDRGGKVIARFAPTDTPEALTDKIGALVAQPA